ncbi:MAG: zinc transporter ZupT [Muribaculaceae bacterium]
MIHQIDFDTFFFAILLTLIAGMSTGVGALMAFLTRKDNKRVLSWALGLSAGVMVYISFMEMLPEAMADMKSHFSDSSGGWYGLLAFFSGIGLIALIDWIVPEAQNPHENHSMDEVKPVCDEHKHLKRQGFLLALAIGIHNFPEGMATFVSALEGWKIALPIVIAIAIHNIPEGIAVAVPIYQATGSRVKAMRYSILSGLVEPVGALIGGLVLMSFWTPGVNGIIMAAVAGIMVYISFDELLPSAHSYGHHHAAIIGVILGFALMALSLELF